MQEHNQRRSWTLQLRREHGNICFQHRVGLKTPAFELTDNRRKIGAWLPATRTIQIAAHLIREYSWDVVINILRHEMAHQYADEVLQAHEPAHGPAYKKACDILGVLPAFRSATGRVPRTITDSAKNNPRQTGMLARIDKLLSLARSANLHEAAVAMRKANELMKKYNLERLEQQQPSEYEYLVINPKKKRLDVTKKLTASLLQDFFFVDVVYAGLYDAETEETHKTIELLGSRENVAMAGYVYDFIDRRTVSLWQEYKKQHQAPQKLRRSYILGLIKGFREKLALTEKIAGPDKTPVTSALILARDAGLTDFINLRFPRLRKVTGRGTRIHPDTYSAGKKAGQKIIIHRGIEQSSGFQGRLLPLRSA